MEEMIISTNASINKNFIWKLDPMEWKFSLVYDIKIDFEHNSVNHVNVNLRFHTMNSMQCE